MSQGKTVLKEKKKVSDFIDTKKLDAIIASYDGKQGKLLGILEQAQEAVKYKYLPEEVLNYIALKTGVPLSRLYSVITFYAFFNMKPQGDHTIIVCRGTACHTKGSKSLLDDLASRFGCQDKIEGGEPSFTTDDNKFTVRTVACFGQCALAPVVSIDGIIYSNVTNSELSRLLGKVTKGGKK
ncbi:MAG: NAD(P)H-dependent oxidoreductase subunit E [Candidatus Goldiibacteriota bacterium HGW-Goldbacteria-1]|jgi:NADH-quinone oxidoreductase subunit E|nr:MAG: NAD(P)H-dependent oxidoreductase subunit E [Candidatus Goldiibacteriota bacterium HGW-Goldbacteria-1]